MGNGASAQAQETCQVINGTLSQIEVAADRTRTANLQLDRAYKLLLWMVVNSWAVYRLPAGQSFCEHKSLAPEDIVSAAAANVRLLKDQLRLSGHSVDLTAIDGAYNYLIHSVRDLKCSLDDSMQLFDELKAQGAVVVCGIP